MNDQTNIGGEEDEGSAPVDQLQLLKDRATTMGIHFSNNIGIEALRKKINAKLDGKTDEDEQAAETKGARDVPAAPAPRKLTRAEMDQQIRTTQTREQMALVRCRIYNLDPAKRDLHGEFITVANRFVGTVRKFIPFGEATEAGFHLETILFNELKQRKFQQIKTLKEGGKITVKTQDVPEYSIEVLPMLTRAELQELALTQQAAERVGV